MSTAPFARALAAARSGTDKLAEKDDRMNLRLIDWIWRIRGSVDLAPDQTSDDAFDRLGPLLRQSGTSHERTNDTLTFRKKDQTAQDKLSIFDGGVLCVEHGSTGPVLRYQLTSRALLFCFLAPLLFVGLAQLTIITAKHPNPSTEAADKAKKAAKKAVVPMNAFDKAMGAPAPEKPGKDAARKAEERKKKPSPTNAYVFAAIFAALYVVGRILEERLVKSLFRKLLLGA